MNDSSATAIPPRTIDVLSDVVCPWCYIGKRQLESALPAAADRAHVRWHPFELNPDLPREGIPRRQYVETKFGARGRADEVYARVRAAGENVGLRLDFERIVHQPNTFDAHRLIAWAQSRSDATMADRLVEALFRAFFVDGRDIGHRDELADIAAASGFERLEARSMLDSDEAAADVMEMRRRVREMGVGGVPFFIFDGKVAVSGAQPPDVLQEAMAQARGA